jgi:hypothetical protein
MAYFYKFRSSQSACRDLTPFPTYNERSYKICRSRVRLGKNTLPTISENIGLRSGGFSCHSSVIKLKKWL